ncbi:MAG: hypoxanthine phosphoribosyltransferase [Planctomycetaceae bacterium]|nr:hypoxanthine phosphoribosyltransferase [Planctomycetaceae bacterium]
MWGSFASRYHARLDPGRRRAGVSSQPGLRAVHDDIERVLISPEEIRAGIERVAGEVTHTYRGTDFTVVGVLKGSCVFVSDLIRAVPIPLELAFLSASSYRDGTTSGRLDLSFFPAEGEIAGKRLLLVDDILDTGRTMQALVDTLMERGALDVKTCVFLDKPSRRLAAIQPDFRAFAVEDLFVVGYGLDFAGRYRNLPYVGALRPALYASAAPARG